MKTVTTFTAVVALIAGMSVANAAMSSKSSTMGAGMSSSMSKTKVSGKSKFCIKSSSGALNCKYASLSACQTANKGKTCTINPNMGTTGAK
jgi:hypothetical protein